MANTIRVTVNTKLVIEALMNYNLASVGDVMDASGLSRDVTMQTLREMEVIGLAGQRNGYWWLPPAGAVYPKLIQEEAENAH